MGRCGQLGRRRSAAATTWLLATAVLLHGGVGSSALHTRPTVTHANAALSAVSAAQNTEARPG